MWRLFKRKKKNKEAPTGLRSTIGGVRRLGLSIVFGLFGGVAIWSSTVELPRAVISSGVIRTEAPVHSIEHPDGGVVQHVFASEGMSVQEGDLLIQLDAVSLKNERDKLRRDLLAAQIERTRIATDLRNQEDLSLDQDMSDEIDVLGMHAAEDLEELRLQAQRDARRRLAMGLDAQIAGLDTTLGALEQRLGFEEAQVDRAGNRIEKQRKLHERGRLSAQDLEQAERSYLGLKASVAETGAELARTRLEREQAWLERQQLPKRDHIDLLARLAELDRQIPDLSLRVEQIQAAVERTEIRSPADGSVINIQIKAFGAVVAPHEPILEIVPNDDQFTMEMRVAPTDVDRVVTGMRAQVTLSAFPQRLMPRIEGVVTRVSGDRTIAPEDGSAHYLVWLTLDQASLDHADAAVPFDITLKPGMPVEAFILTGENTLLGHLLDPLRRTFDKSFRDG